MYNINGYHSKILNKIEEYNSNGKKTALIVCDAFYPSIDGVVKTVDNYMQRIRNYNVILLAPCPIEEAIKRDYPIIRINGLKLINEDYRLPLPELSPFAFRCLKKLKVDIVHCHSPFNLSREVAEYEKRRGAKIIMHFHSQYKRDFEKRFNKGLSSFLMKYVLKTYSISDEVWTMHGESLKLLRSYGYLGKTVLMPNATDLQVPKNYEEIRSRAREEFNLGDKHVLLFVGRVIEEKGVLFTVDVLVALKEMNFDFEMIYVGDGKDLDRLKEKVKKVGLYGNCRFVGLINDREELSKYLAVADLLLFPSMYDTDALVRIEAAAFKLPMALLENSVTSCTVTGGVNGLILPRKADVFAEKISSLLSDEKALSGMREACRKDLYLDYNSAIKKVEEEYDNLLSNKKIT